jgi:hypothetical protein
MECMANQAPKKIFNGIALIEMIGPDQFRMEANSGETRYFNGRGELHRKDGPAVKDKYGNESWYQNGLLHRDDGPATTRIQHEPRTSKSSPLIPSGKKALYWYRHGVLHREDGPAVIIPDERCLSFPNGPNNPLESIRKGCSRWYVNGEPVDSLEEQAALTARPKDLTVCQS